MCMLLCAARATAQDSTVVIQDQPAGEHVAFSRDGRYFVTTGEHGPTLLWETASGKLLRELPRTNQGVTQYYSPGSYSRGVRYRSGGLGVAFSPDGRYVAAVSMPLRSGMSNGLWSFAAPSVWEIATGEALHPASTWERKDSLLINPDMPWTGSEIIAWSTVDTDSAAHLLRNYKGPASRFSRDGRIGAAIDSLHRVTFLELPSNRLIGKLPDSMRSGYNSALSHDGKWLAARPQGYGIRIWSVATQQPVAAITDSLWVRLLAFSPDDKILAVADYYTVVLYATDDWRRLSSFGYRSENWGQTGVNELVFSRDSKLLAVGGDGLRIIEVPSGRLHLDSIGTSLLDIQSLAIHDSVMAVARENFGYVREYSQGKSAIELWPLNGGGPFVLARDLSNVSSIAINPDATQLAAGTAEGITVGRYTRALAGGLYLWDLDKSRQVLGGYESGPTADVAFSRDGKWLYSMENFEIEMEEAPCPKDEYCGAPEEIPYSLELVRTNTRSLSRKEVVTSSSNSVEQAIGGLLSPAADRVLRSNNGKWFTYDVVKGRRDRAFNPDSALLHPVGGGWTNCASTFGEYPTSARISSDGRFAAFNLITYARVIDMATGASVMRSDSTLHEEAIGWAGISAGGKALVVVSCNDSWPMPRLSFLDIATSDTLTDLQLVDIPDDIVFREDGKFLVRTDGTIWLHDRTGQRLAAVLSDRQGHWLVVTPDGKYDGAGDPSRFAVWLKQGAAVPLSPESRVPGLLKKLLSGP